ncbi:MAG TPA: biopolymer transporter ExbD [Gemmatimonadaceae bacterium]|nr:biopolymer transporter ExbD [Gemmatimonadaceae bacterium]
MAMSTGGNPNAVKAEPNVTPMIDVMLVLLIIFMLVVPAIAAGFQAVPPQGVNLKAHPEENEDQVLGIDANGQYFLNKKPIRNETLAEQVKRIYDARTVDKIMYVKADRNLDYVKVQDAVDIISKNGVRVAGMITDQQPGTSSTVAGDNPLAAPKKGGP